MDTFPIPALDDAEIERRLLARAVEQARSYKGPLTPNDDACAEMEREIAELDLEIAALTRQ
jgi:hypothetical protein